MDIQTREQDKAVVVALSGRLDAVTVVALEAKLKALIDEGRRAVVINFAALEYISSAGLRCILSAAKKLQAGQGRLLLASLEGMVKEVFELAGFYDLFPVYPSEEEALKAM